MVPMLRCLFCKRKRRLFKITMVYGGTGCPIKDYIVEFLGSCEQHLRDDHGICSLCVFVLNNLLYIRKCMYSIIAVGRDDDYNNTPFFRFSYVYKHFLENLQKLNYEECETEVDQNVTELLQPLHSSPYEEAREAEYNAHYDDHYRYGTPYADREVQNAFSGRRGRGKGRGRRRGHNWTRRKSARPKSNLTTYSEPIPRRNREQLSTMNFSEYQNSDRSDSDEDEEEITSALANAEGYQNGILPSKRTRLGERQHEVLAQAITKYKCVNDCTFVCTDLNELTEHKIEEHGMLAKYVCYECYATKQFVSQTDLKLHDNQYHSILISNCSRCSVELRTKEDLQKHLREPHPYSCNYCDMFFVNRKSCEAHIDKYHKGKKKKIKRFTRYTIMDRIYRSENTTTNNVSETDKYNGQVIWRLQKHRYVEKLSILCLNILKRHDLRNIDMSTNIKDAHVLSLSNLQYKEPGMEISDNAHEDYVHVENEIAIIESSNDSTTTISNYDETGKNSLMNSNGLLENSENVASVLSKNTFETSAEQRSPETEIANNIENNVLLATNDSFEKFVMINNVKIDGIDTIPTESTGSNEEMGTKPQSTSMVQEKLSKLSNGPSSIDNSNTESANS